MKPKHFIILVLLAGGLVYVWYHLGTIFTKRATIELASVKLKSSSPGEEKQLKRLKGFAKQLRTFSSENNYNTSVCFLVDMKQHSGKNRFFVYDLSKDSILSAGLVAHGNCNKGFLINASFSNQQGCGCTSIGKYVVCNKYNGRFGPAFKLRGLEKSNSNAFNRFVVLHGYDCVPDYETYPMPVCNSLGCPMVSYHFLDKLSGILKTVNKPIVLYIFN